MTRGLMRALFAVTAVTAVLALPACSSHDSAGETGSSASESNSQATHAPRTTLTQAGIQPPPLHNQYTNNGRPDVTFDPCTWIPDDAILSTGFDPSSRKRGDDQVAEETFLECVFTSKDRSLSVISGNVSWQEDLAKNRAISEPVSVNGRQAIWVRDPIEVGRCQIHLQTRSGFAAVAVDTKPTAQAAGVKPCDGVLDIAKALEPSIGKDN
ncbi:DUF3558 domain-containing protein [Nocardia sp. NPDC003482]